MVREALIARNNSRLEINKIYHGECIEIMSEWPEKCIDLIFADPPYNLSGAKLEWRGNKTGGDWFKMNEDWDQMDEREYMDFTYEWLEQAKRVLRDNSSIYISCTYHNIGELIINLKRLGFKCLNIITWYKSNSMPSMTKRQFTHACEYILYFAKGSGWIFNYEAIKRINPEKTKEGAPKQMRDLWVFPLCQGRERIKAKNGRAAHPTQKPEALLERVIIASSNKGDLVLDPFLGSGTTAAVAKKLGRNWVGIEREEKYIRIARKRLEKVQSGLTRPRGFQNS